MDSGERVGGKEAGCCGLEPLTVALKINQLYSNRNDVGVRLLRSSPVLGFRTWDALFWSQSGTPQPEKPKVDFIVITNAAWISIIGEGMGSLLAFCVDICEDVPQDVRSLELNPTKFKMSEEILCNFNALIFFLFFFFGHIWITGRGSHYTAQSCLIFHYLLLEYYCYLRTIWPLEVVNLRLYTT